MKFFSRWWVIVLGLSLILAACTTAPPEVEVEAPAPTAVEVVEEVAVEEPTEVPQVEEPTVAPEPVVEAEPSESGQVVDTSRYDEFEIITLLPQDAIPAIDNPQFHTAEEANDFYEPDELVMGVVFNGDARAYSVPHLSRHEIVNDEVGGVKIAVTW